MGSMFSVSSNFESVADRECDGSDLNFAYASGLNDMDTIFFFSSSGFFSWLNVPLGLPSRLGLPTRRVDLRRLPITRLPSLI
jgi:hypothetical protein